ncbi:DUF4388 domain-containing protein [Planctomycetota bacterium]
MGLSGDLSSINLADVFQMLATGQDKQVLTIQNGEVVKHFVFAANQLSIGLNQKKLGPIGQLLMHLGKLTEEQLNESLAEQQKSGNRVGECIMRLGFCTQHDVEAVFRMQMEEEIYEVLEWPSGSFQVDKPEDVDMGEVSEVLLSFDVMSILMEAARRQDEWQNIRANLPSMDDIFAKANTFDISPDDPNEEPIRRTLAKYIDGTITLRGLIEKIMLPRFEIMAIINEFYVEGKLRRLTSTEMIKVAEAYLKLGKQNYCFQIMERIAQIDPANVELVEKIANIYASSDRKKDAGRHYEALAGQLLAANDIDRAIEYANKSLKIDRYNISMRVLVFTKALESNKIPEAVNSARYLVVYYSEKQNWTDAINTCNHILQAKPENVEFRSKLVDVLLEMGDEKQAMQQCEYLEQVLKKDSLQMIKIYKKVLSHFPGHDGAQTRITTLTSLRRREVWGNYSLWGAIVASAAAGIFFTLHFYDYIDNLIHL